MSGSITRYVTVGTLLLLNVGMAKVDRGVVAGKSCRGCKCSRFLRWKLTMEPLSHDLMNQKQCVEYSFSGAHIVRLTFPADQYLSYLVQLPTQLITYTGPTLVHPASRYPTALSCACLNFTTSISTYGCSQAYRPSSCHWKQAY